MVRGLSSTSEGGSREFTPHHKIGDTFHKAERRSMNSNLWIKPKLDSTLTILSVKIQGLMLHTYSVTLTAGVLP